MCTVSFVNTNGKVVITSNRDEQTLRPSAIEPKNYLINNKNVIFPKDQKAGGTWFAVNENGTVVVLLNGAQEKHTVKENYRKSRGLVVVDLISSHSLLTEWKAIDLNKIEPFTLVVFENQELYQLRWNEIEKSTIHLDANQAHIWSSSTLYPKKIREKRSDWFSTFIATKPEVNSEELFNFHRYTEEANPENGLIINRNESLKTLSITQVSVEKNKIDIQYSDLIADRDFYNTFISI